MQVEIRSICPKIIFLLLLCISVDSACSAAGMITTISGHMLTGAGYLLSRAQSVIGSKGVIASLAVAGAVSFYASKALYQRYFTLPEFQDRLTPPPGEDVARGSKKIFTWRPVGLDLSTLQQLRAAGANLNGSELIIALRRDCGAFDIYKHDDLEAVIRGTMPEWTLRPIESGEIHWNDIISTLNYEIQELTKIKEYLRKCSRWRILGDRYCLGAERDLRNAFLAHGIQRHEDQRQMTTDVENQVYRDMNIPVTTKGMIFSTLLGAPNYDTIYSLYWIAYRRLAWLEELKGIIERAAGDQNCFTRIFAVVHDHTVYEVDHHRPVQILATGNAVRQPNVPEAQAVQVPPAGH